MKQPHLLVENKDICENAIIVGDPARVDRVGNKLDSYELIAYNREFKVIRGAYKGVGVTVVSTGIGGASCGIAVEELLQTGVKSIIRVGSAGAMQIGIGLGELVIATGAVRDDGTSKSYVPSQYPAIPDIVLTSTMIKIAEELKLPHHHGIIRSHDSFYTKDEESINSYWNQYNVLAADMETAILFTLGSLRNCRTASVLNNVVMYKGDLKAGVSDYVDEESAVALGEEQGIILALEALTR